MRGNKELKVVMVEATVLCRMAKEPSMSNSWMGYLHDHIHQIATIVSTWDHKPEFNRETNDKLKTTWSCGSGCGLAMSHSELPKWWIYIGGFAMSHSELPEQWV